MKESVRSAGNCSVLIVSSPKQTPRTRTFSIGIENWVEKRLLAHTRHPKAEVSKADNSSG